MGNEDDFSPDYEACDEVRNENSGGQDTNFEKGVLDIINQTNNDPDTYIFE